MKYIPFFFFIAAVFLNAQNIEKKEYISGSFFYTGSNSPHNRTSGALSGYATATIKTYNYITIGYDDLSIEQTDWNYDQKMFIAGGGVSIYPVFVKAHYGRINGNFTGKAYDFNYTDITDLFNIDLFYYSKFLLFRASYTYEGLSEFVTLNVRQYGIGFERYIGTSLYASLHGYLSDISDGRDLYSAKLKLTWFPVTSLSVAAETFFGQRAFFFNTDLLTIFNLAPTQNSLYSLRMEYSVTPELTAIANYQYTEFTGHDTRYYIGGIKYLFSY